MKEKIIFWLGLDLTHFCLSWSLKKQLDANFYAVIDITNKPKRFFQNQKLVNFNKTWFFFEHIKNTSNTVDIDYLINFEKKYKIDLWTIAINERMFYRFFTFHKFSRNEILSILEHECKLFETILDEVDPDFLITKLPSRHHHELFYRLCKARGVKVLMLAQARLGHKSIITESATKFDSSDKYQDLELPSRSLEDLQSFLTSLNYGKQIKKFLHERGNPIVENLKAAIEYLTSTNKETETQYYYYGKTKTKVLFSMIKGLVKRKYRQAFVNKHLRKEVDLATPFVYFPMGVDMEETILIGAPFFTNQTEIIRHVAKSLPINYKIYVKENPAQVSRDWRRISEYQEIMAIPGVEFLHPSYVSENLVKNCALVVTISGTSGFEAAVYGKPVIVFSDTFYSVLPSVHRVREIEDLPHIIRSSLSEKIDHANIDKFVKWLELNTINFDRFGFISLINNFFYKGGRLVNVDISESTMKQFLQKNESVLDELASEHTKKINCHMSQNSHK
jgi:hypothetical protein